jgi:hypothetical protein
MSEIKVNKISPRTACGTTTLGDSGDTFTIPAGVSITNSGTASGFGATGAASWNTTVKTGDFTAVAGEGYFVNTTSGAINVTLPAGSAGSVVAIKDYAKTFDTNAVTLVRNGSDKIGGQTINATLNIEGQAVTLVFIDSTQGWLVTDSGLQSDANQAQFVTATGGTITNCGNFRVHTFTGPGTFCVSSAGNACGSNTVDYLVIAGGGGGGGKVVSGNYENGGGGGAGGYRESGGTASGCYTVSPLGSSPSPVAALPVSVQGYSIVVGGGGPGGSGTTQSAAKGTSGSTSSFSTIASAGGGGAGGNGCSAPINDGLTGGSGGGSAGHRTSPGAVNAGNTPPVSPPQGQPSGAVTSSSGNNSSAGAGGGGALTAGANIDNGPTSPNTDGGPGGNGATSSINFSPTTRAGGGAGSGGNSRGTGGPGGGGNSGGAPGPDGGFAGTTNTGGGGGGSGPGNAVAGNGGSGIVIIRYKYQ